MLNKVELVGRLGMVPEIKKWPSGDEYASFRMATSEKWTDKDGTAKEKTEWHNVTVTAPPLVKFCSFLNKGDLIYIEGKIETRSYNTKDGETKYATEILVKPFQGKVIGLSKSQGQDNNIAKAEETQDDEWADFAV